MPVLTNATTGIVLAQRAEVAGTVPRRLVGLLGRRSFADGEGMCFPQCRSIHTWGMRFAIDVLFLRGFTVVRLVERLRPWRMAWAAGADAAVELPAGTIARTATRVGQRVEWG